MTVRVEFYGIPRVRAGVETVEVDAATFGEALRLVEARLPGFAEHCLDDGRLRSAYLANLNGERFLSDLSTPLCEGDALLILSADVGG